VTDDLAAIVAELAGRVDELEARARRHDRIREILAEAGMQPGFTQPEPKRDRHGLRVVRSAR
jgi:hypothetical protein